MGACEAGFWEGETKAPLKIALEGAADGVTSSVWAPGWLLVDEAGMFSLPLAVPMPSLWPPSLTSCPSDTTKFFFGDTCEETEAVFFERSPPAKFSEYLDGACGAEAPESGAETAGPSPSGVGITGPEGF
jgi:hypothetical protein